MKTIDNFNFSDKRALIRVDFNVPLDENYIVTDDTRIRAAIPTIRKILDDGGSVVLMSHLGRPKSGAEEKFSLRHIVPKLNQLLGTEVRFAGDCIGDEAFSITTNLPSGQVVLLENLRFYKEETAGNEQFSENLSRHGDIYVNDAFGTAHRAHASTTTVARFFPNTKYLGYVMANEINNINKVINEAEKPLTAIMGGAKVSDKILIINRLFEICDNLLIGGGMAYTFIKAQGGNIGNSLVEMDKLDLALEIIEKAKAKNVNLLLPLDTLIADAFDNNAKRGICSVFNIPDGWMGLDIGKETVQNYLNVISNSKTILWNGPMGVFEMPNFENGTKKIAFAIAEATAKEAFSLIGGGDSVAAINKYNLKDEVSYVSTGGGAMLEYLEGKELPGIKAITS